MPAGANLSPEFRSRCLCLDSAREIALAVEAADAGAITVAQRDAEIRRIERNLTAHERVQTNAAAVRISGRSWNPEDTEEIPMTTQTDEQTTIYEQTTTTDNLNERVARPVTLTVPAGGARLAADELFQAVRQAKNDGRDAFASLLEEVAGALYDAGWKPGSADEPDPLLDHAADLLDDFSGNGAESGMVEDVQTTARQLRERSR